MGLAQLDPAVAQPLDPLRAHPEGRLGDEDLLGVVELVDRAFIGIRQLNGAADDGGQHCLQFERGVHRAQHLLQRLQLSDRSGQLSRAALELFERFGAGDRDNRLFGKCP